MNLRTLIANLELMPAAAEVVMSNTLQPPGQFHSWRGVYAELTLHPRGDAPKTAGQLLQEAQSCIGKTFQGYKGGDFTMGLSTDVYADEYGEWAGWEIVGVAYNPLSGKVTIIAHRDTYSY